MTSKEETTMTDADLETAVQQILDRQAITDISPPLLQGLRPVR